MQTEESRERRQNQQGRMSAVLDYTVGAMAILVGLFIFFYRYFPVEFEFREPLLAKVFAGLCLLYGGWRIYRGLNKSRG